MILHRIPLIVPTQTYLTCSSTFSFSDIPNFIFHTHTQPNPPQISPALSSTGHIHPPIYLPNISSTLSSTDIPHFIFHRRPPLSSTQPPTFYFTYIPNSSFKDIHYTPFSGKTKSGAWRWVFSFMQLYPTILWIGIKLEPATNVCFAKYNWFCEG